MAASMTKRVRMNEEMLSKLAEASATLEMTESEVLREGVRGMYRMAQRRKHIHLLKQQAIDVPGDDAVMNWKGRL